MFRDCNDMLFTFGEVDATVYVLVNGWATLSLGATFEEEHTDMHGKRFVWGRTCRARTNVEGLGTRRYRTLRR